MAKPIPTINRSLLTATQNVSVGDSFARMGEAAGQLSEVVTNKLTDIAAQQAATQGAQEAAEGTAPKTLALGLNQPTKAYNKAVEQTEAFQQTESATKQIQEATLKALNPATFNRDTPAEVNAQYLGIVQGTLDNARPETRTQIQNALSQVVDKAQLQVLNHSLDYENKKDISDTADTIAQLLDTSATERLRGNDDTANQAIRNATDYVDAMAVQNQVIADKAPQLKKQIAQQAVVDTFVADYVEASSNNQGAQWLEDFGQNKQAMDFEVWNKVAKQVDATRLQDDKLKAQMRAESYSYGQLQIQKEAIKTASDLNNYVNANPSLNGTDYNRLEYQLNAKQQTQNAQQLKIADAVRHIQLGRANEVSEGMANTMRAMAIDAWQADHPNDPLTLEVQSQIMLGQNDYAASTIKGVPLGRNAPDFDTAVSTALKSENTDVALDAYRAWRNIAVNNKQPNMIKAEGAQLSILHQMNKADTMLNQDALMKTIVENHKPDKVETEIRAQRFRAQEVQQQVLSKFKAFTGVKGNVAESDAVYAKFKNQMSVYYNYSGDIETAFSAVKENMRASGTSDYAAPNQVLMNAPENNPRTQTILQNGNLFQNQYMVGLQNLIDREPRIEWADSNQKIDNANWTGMDYVTKQVDALGSDRAIQGLVGSPLSAATVDTMTSAFKTKRPVVKVDGHLSEVYIADTPFTRMGDKLSWALMYKDVNGVMQYLPDPTNSMYGFAEFTPLTYNELSPLGQYNLNEQQYKERAETALKQQQQTKAALINKTIKEAMPLKTNPITSGIFNKAVGGLINAYTNTKATPEDIKSMAKTLKDIQQGKYRGNVNAPLPNEPPAVNDEVTND